MKPRDESILAIDRDTSSSKTVRLDRLLTALIFITSLFSIVLGLGVLIGWHTHVTSLIQVFPNFVPMQYNTAIGFILCGTALLSEKLGGRRFAVVVGLLAVGIGAITLGEYVFSVNLGIDQILQEHYIITKTSHPGRMAPNTAVCFVLVGLTPLLGAMARRWSYCVVASVILGSLTFGLSIVAISGYLLGIEAAYGWAQLTRMAVHTALGFVALSVSTISMAWRLDLPRGHISPKWLPAPVCIGILTITVCFWQAIEAEIRHATTVSIAEHSHSHIANILLITGIILAVMMIFTTTLWQKNKQRSQEIKKANLSMAEEINMRKQAEEELRLHSEIVKNMSESIYLVGAEDGIIFWANPKFEKMFGYDAGEMKGQHASIVNAPTEKDPMETAREIMEVLNETGEWHGEVYNINKNGMPFWCYANCSLFDHPEYGRVIVAVHMDITEHKQAEEELLRYAHIVSSSSDMLAFLDTNFIYLATNKEYLAAFGMTKDQVVGHSVSEVFGEEFFEATIRPNAERCLGGEEVHYQEWFHFPVYGEKFMEITYYPYTNGENEVQGFVVNGRDITEHKQAEDALIESEERYRSLVENIDFGITIIDTDYNVVMTNDTVGRWFSKSPSEFVGKKCYQVFEKKDHPCSPCPGAQAMATGKPCEIETDGVRDDGTRFTVKDRAFPYYGPNGEIKGFHEILEDITERKQAEMGLKESHERFEAIMDSLDSLVYVADFESYELLFVNKYGRDIWGDVVGRKCWQSLQTDQTGPCEFCTNDRLLDENRKATGVYTWELHNTVNNHWYECHDQAIPWTDGRLVRMQIATDITERKQAEEALQRERDNLINIFDSVQDGVYIADQDYNIQYVNPALLREFGPVEERKCYEYFHARKEACTWCKNADVLAGKTVQWEWRSEKTGKTYDLIDTPVNNPDGTISKLEIFRDITERKRSEEALQDKTKEMETMLRAVSHDLRSPLVNIDGFSGELASDCKRLVGMLENVNADEETLKQIETLASTHIPESISFIRKGTKNMDGLLKGLSQLAKIGAAKLNIQPLDINDIAQQVADTMKFSARKAGAAIELETLPNCLGDEVQINQVFSNLVGNAVKYLDPERPGLIRIWGKVEGNMSQYCIEDNGVGIPDNHKSKVFEIFHRVDPKSPVSGDGLGLTTVKQIVERHEGRIWLESEQGKGSKFFITIPLSYTLEG